MEDVYESSEKLLFKRNNGIIVVFLFFLILGAVAVSFQAEYNPLSITIGAGSPGEGSPDSITISLFAPSKEALINLEFESRPVFNAFSDFFSLTGGGNTDAVP
jgi:hypothetical protein